MCNKTGMRVMQFGIPGYLCSDENCSVVWGSFTWLWLVLPFNGWFITYEKGGYWRALWHFLRGDHSGDEYDGF
jgi:hypothetical protein